MKKITSKPALFPLECILRPTHIGGQQIIIIEELLRLVVRDDINIMNYEVYVEIPDFYAIKWTDHVFGYDKSSLSFLYLNLSEAPLKSLAVPNQWLLFLVLIKNKIDFRGLIEQGRAVSALELSENSDES